MPDVIEIITILAQCQKTFSTDENSVIVTFVADLLGVSTDRVMELLEEHATEIAIINSED